MSVRGLAAVLREAAGDNGPGGRQPTFLGGYLTEWDEVTHANKVALGGFTYDNLPVINPALLGLGPVLLAYSDEGPIVLGRIYRYQQEGV
jgi:hypothetical protein